MEHNHTDHMKENILRKIRANELSMHPKMYFTLKVAALVVVALLVLVVSIFIFNFVLFSIRINNHDSLLGFGPRGVLVFLALFPWTLLLWDIVFIVILGKLLRQFRFGYQTPILYVFLGVILVTGFSAFALDRGTPFNDRLLDRADRHNLPLGGEFFEGARRPIGGGVCKCTVVSIEGNVLIVVDERAGSSTFRVILPPNDPRATTTMLEEGDTIFLAGDRDGNVIRAFGVRRIPPPR